MGSDPQPKLGLRRSDPSRACPRLPRGGLPALRCSGRRSIASSFLRCFVFIPQFAVRSSQFAVCRLQFAVCRLQFADRKGRRQQDGLRREARKQLHSLLVYETHQCLSHFRTLDATVPETTWRMSTLLREAPLRKSRGVNVTAWGAS
eukprot:scaffold2096_cov221-Pinguiococcus_pyrenoidosus.AAC.9